MPRRFRDLKSSSLIREELGEIILRELEFGGALITITEVEVSPDMKTAKINFSVLPAEKAERVLNVLNKFRRKLQYLLQRKIEMKPMPQISFVIDRGLAKAADLEKVFLEVEKKGRNK